MKLHIENIHFKIEELETKWGRYTVENKMLKENYENKIEKLKGRIIVIQFS